MARRDRRPDFKSLLQDPGYQLHLGLGNYAKISKTVIGGKDTWKKVKHWIEEYSEEFDEKFKDFGWEGVQGLGEAVGRGISNFLGMYKGLAKDEKPDPKVVLKSMRELNGGKNAKLFGDLRIRNQKLWDPGFVYLVDALNTLSTQPSLIYRLFERKKLKKDGIHPVWININGKWQNLIMDELIPIIETAQERKLTLFLQSSLKNQIGIWAPLLFKALVKSISPSYNQARVGYEPYAVHSLTGTPYSIYDIMNLNQRGELTERDQKHIKKTWEKLKARLSKGNMISVTSRLPTQRERLRIGDFVNKLGIWAAQRNLSAEDFFCYENPEDNFDFSGLQGLDYIVKLFDNIGLKPFQEIEVNGEIKLFIKPGFGSKLKHNLNGYVNQGIWSIHNYAVVTIKEVVDSKGASHKLLKLRNCWEGEEFTGMYSRFSEELTPEIKKHLQFDEGDKADFWMDIIDFMSFFECMNVYKTRPGFVQEAIPVKFPLKNFLRAVIKINVQVKGKYTFSVDQKDLHMYKNAAKDKYRHNPIKLTLGQFENGQFQILSHTSSNKLRNTYIRKVINAGDYYLLIEQDTRLQQPQNRNPELNVSSYGPKSTNPKVLESTIDELTKNEEKFSLPEILTKNLKENSLVPVSPPSGPNETSNHNYVTPNPLFDYLLYQSWKNYSQKRPGILVKEFNVNFYDSTWQNLNLYLLNVPDMIVYAFQNPHSEFGVELKAKIKGTKGVEAIGPGTQQICENDFLTNQNFGQNAAGSHIFDLMSNNGTDIFILRDKEETSQDNSLNKASNFKVESVVGVKYLGVKDKTVKSQDIYNWLVEKTKPKSWKFAEIEKDDRIGEPLGVFDPASGKKHKFKNEVIQLKKKRVHSRMERELIEDKLEIVDNGKGLGQKLKNVVQNQSRGSSVLNQRTRHKSLSVAKSPNQQKSFEFKEESNVLQVGDPRKNKARRLLRKAKDLKRSKTQGTKKRSKSILKNANKNRNQEQENIKKQGPTFRKESLEEKIKKDLEKKKPSTDENKEEIGFDGEIPPIEEAKLSKMLNLNKEELFDLDSTSLKQLIKYFGYDTFVSLHKLNKFEICALDKHCDSYLAYLEAKKDLEQDKKEENYKLKPDLNQVMDLNDVLNDLAINLPSNTDIPSENEANMGDSEVVNKLVDQNGDELDVQWNQIGELVILDKYGEQVYIEGELPPQFIPPMPEELKASLENQTQNTQKSNQEVEHPSENAQVNHYQNPMRKKSTQDNTNREDNSEHESSSSSEQESHNEDDEEEDEDALLQKEMERIRKEKEKKKQELEKKRREIERQQRELMEEEARIQRELEQQAQEELNAIKLKAKERLKKKARKSKSKQAQKKKTDDEKIEKTREVSDIPQVVQSVVPEPEVTKSTNQQKQSSKKLQNKKSQKTKKSKHLKKTKKDKPKRAKKSKSDTNTETSSKISDASSLNIDFQNEGISPLIPKNILTQEKNGETKQFPFTNDASPKGSMLRKKKVTRENIRDLREQVNKRTKQELEARHKKNHPQSLKVLPQTKKNAHRKNSNMLQKLRKMNSSTSKIKAELEVTADKVADFGAVNKKIYHSKTKSNNGLLLYKSNYQTLTSTGTTPSHKISNSMKNLKFASARNFGKQSYTPMGLRGIDDQPSDDFKGVNQTLKERIQNIKNMQGVVNKYFSKKTRTSHNPLTYKGKSKTKIENNKEQIQSGKTTPPNKEKLKNFFFYKENGDNQNNKNHLNFYNKASNKSYGAIKQLDITIKNDISTSPHRKKRKRIGGLRDKRRITPQRRIDLDIIGSTSASRSVSQNAPVDMRTSNISEVARSVELSPERLTATQKAFNPLLGSLQDHNLLSNQSKKQQKLNSPGFPTVIDMRAKIKNIQESELLIESTPYRLKQANNDDIRELSGHGLSSPSSQMKYPIKKGNINFYDSSPNSNPKLERFSSMNSPGPEGNKFVSPIARFRPQFQNNQSLRANITTIPVTPIHTTNRNIIFNQVDAGRIYSEYGSPNNNSIIGSATNHNIQQEPNFSHQYGNSQNPGTKKYDSLTPAFNREQREQLKGIPIQENEISVQRFKSPNPQFSRNVHPNSTSKTQNFKNILRTRLTNSEHKNRPLENKFSLNESAQVQSNINTNGNPNTGQKEQEIPQKRFKQIIKTPETFQNQGDTSPTPQVDEGTTNFQQYKIPSNQLKGNTKSRVKSPLNSKNLQRNNLSAANKRNRFGNGNGGTSQNQSMLQNNSMINNYQSNNVYNKDVRRSNISYNGHSTNKATLRNTDFSNTNNERKTVPAKPNSSVVNNITKINSYRGGYSDYRNQESSNMGSPQKPTRHGLKTDRLLAYGNSSNNQKGKRRNHIGGPFEKKQRKSFLSRLFG